MCQGSDTDRRALLIHQGAIGDFLVASRLMGLCDRQFGPHRWTYLGKAVHGRLAQALQLIDHFEDFSHPGWHLLFAPNETPPESIQRFLPSFDLVVNLVCGPETLFAQRLASFCRGTCFHVEPQPPADYDKHVLAFQADQIGIAVDRLPKNAYQPLPEIVKNVRRELENAEIDPAGLLLLHPGASSATKRWPVDNFLELARLAREKGYEPGVLLGEVELEQFSENDILRLKSSARSFFDWPLEKLAGLFWLSRGYIGNDNGISHLAGVMGIETKVIFVNENWKNWQPIGPNVEIVPPDTVKISQLFTGEK